MKIKEKELLKSGEASFEALFKLESGQDAKDVPTEPIITGIS